MSVNVCHDCGRFTKKGYKTRGTMRCDACHEDWVRRSTKEETYTRFAGRDRDRKTKHRSVDT